ncbi:MAG: hypothetical protein OER97_08820 [Gammaproteobacteria bacterium]|nr:hypothetical protein [Gammaproteobacteria bacterium]
MPATESPLRRLLTREVALLTVLLFVGFVLMPIAIWFVGQALFGAYGGHGFGDFFGTLSAKIRAGDRVAWFLVLSPYLAILCLRLMVWGWRRTAQQSS